MTLKEKCVQLYKVIECVEKGGRNTAQGYDYVKAVDMVQAFRKACLDLNIYAEINMEFAGPPFTVARSKDPNTPFTAINVRCSGVLYDIDSTETKTFSGLGCGCDSNDKAVYKAQTGALKYALKHAGLIPDEGAVDPEADETVDEEPDFQDARRGRPAPSHTKPEAQKSHDNQKAAATAKASTSPAPAPTTVTKAEIPAAPVQQKLPASTDSDEMPTEQEMKEYRDRYRKLGDDLSEPAKGGLKTSRSNPINRKIAAYMCVYVGAKNPTDVTKAQWTKFLKHVDDTIALENGYKQLAKLIDPEAFKEV